MSTYAAVLARHVVTLRHDNVPSGVREQAVRLITDAIGAGIYGTTTASGTAIFQEARSRYRSDGSLVWGRSETLDPAGAASPWMKVVRLRPTPPRVSSTSSGVVADESMDETPWPVDEDVLDGE